jgi:hypothetical protein
MSPELTAALVALADAQARQSDSIAKLADNALVFASALRIGAVPVAAQVTDISVAFATPYPAATVPVVCVCARLPGSSGDFITASLLTVSNTGFTARLSAYVEVSGYDLEYIALAQI